MHKSQIFFYLLSVFILGVFAASFFNFSSRAVLVLAIIGISAVVLSGFTPTPERESLNSSASSGNSRLVWGFKNKFIILTGFLILAFVGGVARFNYFDLNRSNLADFTGQDVILKGYINSEPDIDGNRMRFVFKTMDERVLITTNAFPRQEFGDRLSIKGELEFPQNFTGFDYITYLKKDGIRTTIFYPKEIETSDIDLKRGEKVKIIIYRSIFSLKNKFQNAINLSIPEPNAAFINGILLGTRQNIPDHLKDAFSKTGTTHILAISGYNIMIISWAVLAGLIWFFKRRVAFWISVAVIILFVILTGASASVVRAAVMGLLLSFAHGYGRLYDQKNSIILAGATMIWFNPMVLVFDTGFQLSFMAVLGLIYIYPWLDHKLYKIWKLVPILFSTKSKLQNRGSSISQSNQDDLREIGSGLKELFLMTLSAQIAVAPLLIYYFGKFSLWSLPANILILPFIPAAMLAGFIAGLAGMVFGVLGPLDLLGASNLIGYIAWAITTYQIEIVKYFALLS